ncbi:MAG: hypothetical protein J6S26_03355 [Solobacterium sp.]|nr:hypothetical protein [Solobacterium sp.]
MKYGYFDDQNREYVITRPDTPAPWANYLGSVEYGALISANAGGYSFVRSGAKGRILRYLFTDSDQPGRYMYIRDNVSKDYWSASWQPVGKDLKEYKSEVRHGQGYTSMDARYAGIHSKAYYYVPEGKSYEVWYLKVENESDAPRSLTLSAYAEFTNNSNYEQDLVNLQYSRFITKTEFREDRIVHLVHPNLSGNKPEGNNDSVEERFLGLAGSKVSSFCGDKTAFLGAYHSYGNPIGVESGDLGGELNYNEYGCGALSTVIELAPSEAKAVAFVLGAKGDEEAKAILASYADPEAAVTAELQELKDLWTKRFAALKVNTPSEEFNTMINIWNAYNCYMTVLWSRAASFVYCGLRNGYGYRDTVQDIQGIIHLDPATAKDKLRFMLSAQVHHGGGLPLVKFTHNPGHEDTPEDDSYVRETGHPAYRADDALWLFPTVYKYISETGDTAFLDEVIPFADHDEAPVYEHLKRAIQFSLDRLGPHGMPAGLYADWNDCLRLGKEGESAFVAMQFYYALEIQRRFAAQKEDSEAVEFLTAKLAETEALFQKLCWNEDRFIRGYKEDGEVIGRRDDPEANMWLNPQSWSVISGLASPEQADLALENVHRILNTDYGVILMDPPYHDHAFDGALAVIYNPGVKENSGIFSQTQGWIILAEALRGHGDRAFEYFMENAPSAQNDRAEIRHLEPYCYGQFTEGKASPHFGRSHVHWLTGTASTVMTGCVEGILGLRPDFDGLRLAPAIPSRWDGFEMEKEFRGSKLHITVRNPNHKESGFVSMTVNGKAMKDNYIPASILTPETEVELVIS